MASILVLGATGYVGGRLVPRLLQRGHTVRCLVVDSHLKCNNCSKNTSDGV